MSKLGTEEAEQIIRQYSDMIYRIAVHNLSNIADAEDILQDVCISLLTKCPKQRDSEHLKAWLIRVTINKCIPWIMMRLPSTAARIIIPL